MFKNIMNKTSNVVVLILLTIIIANIVIVYSFFSLYSKEDNNVIDLVINEEMHNSPMIIELESNNEEIIGNELIEEIPEIDYPTGDAKYYIKVNVLAQTVTIYSKDINDSYSKPIKSMVCSTGESTPIIGVYKTTSYKKEWLKLEGGVYGLYCSQIVGDILFHSVPYLEYGNHASLEYWEYNKLGTEASLGCVRLTAEDAKWIYDNCDTGTMVEFYSDSNPGPLGKPSAVKIPENYKEVSGWDPTDNAESNPWIRYRNDAENNIENNIEEKFIQDQKENEKIITDENIDKLKKSSKAIQVIERVIDIMKNI